MIDRRYSANLVSAAKRPEEVFRKNNLEFAFDREGLLMDYDAQNPSSYPATGTAITDISPGGNSGTLEADISFEAGRQGGLYLPDSKINGVHVSSASAELLALQAPMTIIIAFKWRTANGSGNAELFSQYTLASSHKLVKLFRISTSDRLYYLSSSVAGTFQNKSSGLTVSKNVWHIAAAIVTEGGVTQFLDGVFSNEEFLSALSATPDTTVPIYIGRNTYSTATINYRGPFWGTIDRCAVYGKALSKTEMLQAFNSMRGRYGI